MLSLLISFVFLSLKNGVDLFSWKFYFRNLLGEKKGYKQRIFSECQIMYVRLRHFEPN